MQAKDQSQQKKKDAGKDIKVRNIEFVGIVREINSGDSLTIASIKSKNVARFFLTNVKAPKVGNNDSADEPYAFEAREFLRKKLIGQQVDVIFDYEKTVKVVKAWEDEKEGTERLMNFATVSFQGQIINIQLVQEGFAKYNFSRTEEEKSRFHDEIKAAEEEAAKKKKGVHSTKAIPLHRVNDISRIKNKPKLAEAFSFLKGQSKLTGVVDLAVSGGIFKIRLNEESYSILVLLSGVRCLPPDSNIPEYKVWSEKAFDYAKNNLLHRDVEIQLEKMDNKGKFHASIILNKQNYASTLLKEGLCFTFGGKSKNSDLYESIEQEAAAAKKGIHGAAKLNIDILRDQKNFDVAQKQVKPLNLSVVSKLSEFVSTDEFYYQDPVKIPALDKIEKELDDFDIDSYPKLIAPIANGTPCIAVFSGDNNYYRGKIIKKRNDNKYEVFFVDYGFYDNVHLNDMCKLPEKWANVPPTAQKLALAYCSGVHDKHPLANDSDDTFRDLAWSKKVCLNFVYEDTTTKYVVIQAVQGQALNQSVNFHLLKRGLVKLDTTVALPEAYISWEDEEAFASEKKIGLWGYDEEDL